MYSAALIKEDVLAAKRLIKDRNRKLTRAMDRVNKLLLEMKRECDGYGLLESVAPLAQVLAGMQGSWRNFWRRIRFSRTGKACWSFIFRCGIFSWCTS